MNWTWLKNVLPTHEPVLYVFVALVVVQVFVQHQPITEDYIQYLLELAGALGLRQVVSPLAKLPRSGIEVGERSNESKSS